MYATRPGCCRSGTPAGSSAGSVGEPLGGAGGSAGAPGWGPEERKRHEGSLVIWAGGQAGPGSATGQKQGS